MHSSSLLSHKVLISNVIFLLREFTLLLNILEDSVFKICYATTEEISDSNVKYHFHMDVCMQRVI